MNRMCLSFLNRSENVGLARVAVAAFAAGGEFTVSDLEEIKVAVSEAVTNAVVHAYGTADGEVTVRCELGDGRLVIEVEYKGQGIADVEQARTASFSTDPERLGLGFVFLESFSDQLVVESTVGVGTRVKMVKLYRTGVEGE
jgi:stage II sporulation protein AB (anti-sigma F factor)